MFPSLIPWGRVSAESALLYLNANYAFAFQKRDFFPTATIPVEVILKFFLMTQYT